MPQIERASIITELTPPFLVHHPEEWTQPFVFCSPHSGRTYPQAMLNASRLAPQTLRKSEDCFVDELFADIPMLGAPLLAAKFPRAYVDVNREPYELDPELFAEPLPEFANTHSMRVIGGLGTIARIVSDQVEIYDQPLSLAAAFERIDRLYKPFHAKLADLLNQARNLFGYAILVDCHSMPSASLSQPAASRPDFILGDRFGTSCDPRLIRDLRDIMRATGYHTQLNRPYAGGFITSHYGQPTHAIHAIQIEINRGLYLIEKTYQRSPSFDDLREDISAICHKLMIDTHERIQARIAAE